MKNKITKLFLALLTLSFGYNANAQVEDQPMPDYVRKATNIEFLNNFAKEKAAEFETRYNKAVEIAREKRMPIQGEKNGNFFSLVDYEDETGALIYNTTYNNSATASSLQTANAKGLHADGIIGTGMNVGIWDGGVLAISHNGFISAGVNRYSTKDGGNSWSQNSLKGRQHAAHVAGTVAANTFGSGVAMGFAHGAKVFGYNWDSDTSEMAAAAANTSTPIYTSNHSYGLNTEDYIASGGSVNIFGLYGSRSRDFDLVANNAPYYTIVVAAGNDRDGGYNKAKTSGKDLLSQTAVSKNVVVVAATRGTEDFSGITGSVSVGGTNPFISSFSNYGPTNDFRIKPDIAAKGVNVTSVGITSSNATATMDGTSMAAPAVTGVFTLWQSYYKQEFNNYMTSASVRALMAHTAREAGPATGPDFMFGWGLIDAGKGKEVMDAVKANTALLGEFNLPVNSTYEYEFQYDGQDDLVVTMAWNDPAGTADSTGDFNVKKLVNDLDVRLVNEDTGNVYYPWYLVKSWTILPSSNSIAKRDARNDRDNIEKIELPNKIAGNYKVIVTYNGTLQGNSQDYSLIVSGAGGQMPPTDGVASVENLILDGLNIYPNPVNSQLNIDGDLEILENAKVEVFELSGKRIQDVDLNFNSNNATINVSALKPGMYILSISKEGAKQSYKFVKK